MSIWGRQTFLFINTTNPLKVGHGVKATATAGQCDLATAKTDLPLGLSFEDVAVAPASTGPFQAATIVNAPQVAKFAAAGSVAINVLLAVTGTGTFSALAKAADSTTANWCWGRSIETATNANDIFSGIFNWFEMQLA